MSNLNKKLSALPTCEVFSETDGFKYMLFIENHFRPFCAQLGVEEIIFNGTSNNQVISQPHKPERYQIAMDLANQALASIKPTKVNSYRKMLYGKPELVYYFAPNSNINEELPIDITTVKIPVGDAAPLMPGERIAHNFNTVTTLVAQDKVFKHVPGYSRDYNKMASIYLKHGNRMLYNPLDLPDQVGTPLLLVDADLPLNQSDRLESMDYDQCAELFTDIEFKINEWTTEKYESYIAKLFLTFNEPHHQNHQLLFQSIYSDKLDWCKQQFCNQFSELKFAIDTAYENSMKQYNDKLATIKKPFADCHIAMSKFSETNRSICRSELDKNDFHGAITKLNHNFAMSAVNNSHTIKNEIENLRILPGSTLSEHLDRVLQLIRFYADVLQLAYEKRNNTSYASYRLNKELTDDNSGYMTDDQVINKWCNHSLRPHQSPVFIHETDRIKLYEGTFANSRFSSTINIYYISTPPNERTLASFIKKTKI
jgi:hypothetical protein